MGRDGCISFRMLRRKEGKTEGQILDKLGADVLSEQGHGRRVSEAL